MESPVMRTAKASLLLLLLLLLSPIAAPVAIFNFQPATHRTA